MKQLVRFVAVILSLCFCVSLSACQVDSNQTKYIDDYESGYDAGYEDGYEEGKMDGARGFRKYMASEVWSRYWAMEGQTSRERGLHPEEAIIVLNDYLDGEYVSDEELNTAIRSITYFYYHAWDVITDIEDMDIEFFYD